jgi:hypothetical protein
MLSSILSVCAGSMVDQSKRQHAGKATNQNLATLIKFGGDCQGYGDQALALLEYCNTLVVKLLTSPLYPRLIWLKRNAALSGRALTRLNPNLANHLDLTDVRGHPHHDRQTLGAVAAR